MHSTTKYLSGHNLIIGGMVCTDNDEIQEKMEIRPEVGGRRPQPV